jgi:small subunit ribosomal protein S1
MSSTDPLENSAPQTAEPSPLVTVASATAGGGAPASGGDAPATSAEIRNGEGHGPETGPAAAAEHPIPTVEEGETEAETETETETETGGAPAGIEAGHAAAPGQQEPGGEKKRRRRRRKKKGAAAGAPGEAGPGTEGAAADGSRVPSEGGEAASAEESAEAKPSEREASDQAARRDARKKEKKHAGPPRERPPVNIGDIVFGKILEITDEAIFIDIPGKARAIFDRREMLLPDDDDEPRRAPAAAPTAPAEPEGEGPNAGESAAPAPLEGAEAAPSEADEGAPAAGAPSATESPLPEASSGGAGSLAAAESSEPTFAPAPRVEAGVTTTEPGRPTADAGTAPASTSAPDSPPREPREPKVPRVILEVGADFIGVVHNDGARGGLVVLTHHPKRVERAKPAIEKAFNEKQTVEGLVTGVIKGGVEVDVDGLRAFAPGSHVDLRLGADLTHLLGKRLAFVVTQYAKRGRDVVLSRKAMIEEEARKTRAEALARLKVGEDMDGIVRSVVPFGAFVDIGGIEGLVPLQEMSHNRSDGPSDVFTAGGPTRVRVIKIDDKGKVWLSRKATVPDPWQEVARKYAQGTRHQGKVVRLQPFGAFVELEPGVDGLIHTSDLSIKRIESPEEVVKVGDSIDIVVSNVDSASHKIALHPAPQGDAANEAPQRVAPHKAVKARVVNIESGGLVVRILGVTGRNARGYITAAGTGTPRGTELRKAFGVGQEIEAKVIEMDPRRGEVKLSIKALSEEQERSAYQQYRQQLKAEARFTFGDLLAKKKG